MKKWHVGSKVCNGCGALLNMKTIADNIACYLCEAPLDISDLPVVEEEEIAKEVDDRVLNTD